MKAVINTVKANPGKTTVTATALALAVTAISGFEGKANDPYLDIVKVPTVCFGETQVSMHHYTDDECKAMLTKAVSERYMKPVSDCVPQIADKPYQLAASTSLAYNIGIKGFCNSTAAKRFRAGDDKDACEAFMLWNKAGGKVVNGLTKRREAEKGLCLKGVA